MSRSPRRAVLRALGGHLWTSSNIHVTNGTFTTAVSVTTIYRPLRVSAIQIPTSQMPRLQTLNVAPTTGDVISVGVTSSNVATVGWHWIR